LKLQQCGTCKISPKKSKTIHSNRSGHIEADIMQNHEQKIKLEKSENQDFVDKTNFYFSTLPFSP
jgi:hypothetical protein